MHSAHPHSPPFPSHRCALPLAAIAVQHPDRWLLAADAPEAPFSTLTLWEGRPRRQPTKHFPPGLLCSWHFDFTTFGRQELVGWPWKGQGQ